MDSAHISYIIENICEKYNIPYKSNNPHYDIMFKDAEKLGKIYMDLKIIAGDLQIISERHNIKELNNLLHDDIVKIENIEHNIIKIATIIKNEN